MGNRTGTNFAIACGAVGGRGLGQNAVAALIARSFAEMTRFGLALGARAETLAGLSGLGDLVLTSTSPTSRNYSLGFRIAQGENATPSSKTQHDITEGAYTAPVLQKIAKRIGVDMSVVDAVCALLAGQVGIDTVVSSLLARPLTAEI